MRRRQGYYSKKSSLNRSCQLTKARLKPRSERPTKINEAGIEAPVRQTATTPTNVDGHDLEQTFSLPQNNSGIFGRRVVTINCWLDSLNAATLHGQFCSNAKLCFEKEYCVALRSRLLLRCETCSWRKWLVSDSPSEGVTLPVNDSLIWGTNAAGSNYQASKELMTVMDIPFPSLKAYARKQDKVIDIWENVLMEQLLENGKEELRLSKDSGEYVSIDGKQYPSTSVFADGGWCTRSYGHSFKSKGGVAVLIGGKSKKLLHIGVRNMFCVVCKRAENKSIPPPSHTCFKNWDEKLPATMMETRIIEEGFRCSIDTHGLVYSTIVADGDSSVYNSLVTGNIYKGIQIQKAECVNHVVKNLNKFIANAIKDTKRYYKEERNAIKAQVKRFGKSVCAAVKFRSSNGHSHELLRKDLMNVPYHTFGDHTNCDLYFCTKRDDQNKVSEMKQTCIWHDLVDRFNSIASLSSRLIPNLTSNIAESFMSRIAKYNHGKRLNVIQRRGWHGKVGAAAMAFNKGSTFYVDVFQKSAGKAPSQLWQRANSEAIMRVRRVKKYGAIAKQKRKVHKRIRTKPDQHYGPNSCDPDIDVTTVRDLVMELVKSKQVTVAEQAYIFSNTVTQSASDLWIAERKQRITASNAGELFSLLDSTNNSNLIKKILYPKSLANIIAIQHGKAEEQHAILAYQRETNTVVQPSGLIVSLENGIFAASPDGLIGEDGILEVKCPEKMLGFSPWEMPKAMPKSAYLKLDSEGNLKLNEKHHYYKQVIMQLHVTRRSWCDFVVYSFQRNAKQKVDFPLFVQRINRDDTTATLWKKMVSKFTKFYLEDLGPELVNPRTPRGMPIRQPAYRQCAIEAVKNRKKKAPETA